MKINTLFGAGLVLTSLLASCSSEDLLQGSQNAGTNTLTAYIESQNDSRVSISDEGKFAWSTDDKISVASTSNSFETWSLSKINDDGSADFTSSSTVSDGAYAVFPETLNPTVSGGSLQITLPAEYESNKTVPVLTGKYNDGKVDFAHAGGLIRVSFDNIPSSATKFVFSTNNQNITGSFTIDDNNAINTSEGENNTVTINIADGDNVDGNMTFDIPVPVGEYNGFTISIYCGDDLFISQSTSEGNIYTIERRDLLVMPTISFSNYVIETVTPYSTDEKTNILESKFDLSQVTAIYIDGVKLSGVVSSYQFSDSESHTVIIVINDTFNNASYMFSDCSYIDSFDFSHFDTSKVTDMSYMFKGCTSIKTLDLSHFDTSNVSNMRNMFEECALLKTLDLSNFDVSEVYDMSAMFYRCSKLTSLDLSSFKTNKVEDMLAMFDGCTKLSELDISNFDTSNVVYMNQMFNNCSNLTSIDVSNFDTSNVTEMQYMFQDCSSITSLDLSKWDASKVTNMCSMFANCSNLASLELPYKTSKLTDIGSMFYYCSSLKSLDLSNIETKWVTNMSSMFVMCRNLTKITMTGDLSRVSNSEFIVDALSSSGTFYYPEEYEDDYEDIFFSQSQLKNWTKIAQ